MAYTLRKYYQNILGLDLRVSDLLRNQNAATAATNVMFRQTGALSKRNGTKIITESSTGGAGLFKYNNTDIGTGAITEELLCVDNNLHTLSSATFSITYSGSGTAYCDLRLDPDTSTYKFNLYEDGASVLSSNLGTGEGASDSTIDDLATAVNAVTDFSVTYTANTTPAAFVELANNVDFTPSVAATVFTYYYWTQVDTPGTYSNPFTTHWSNKNDSEFEIASTAQMLDVMYITNGYDGLHKYDGNRVYKAGLPQPTTPTDSGGGAGGLTYSSGELYTWKYEYEHTDAKQNILLSQISTTTDFTTTGALTSRVITMTNLTAASGYNTATAVVNGNQVGVNTITVDSGHDLKAGDQVYVNDGVSGGLVKREVTSTTATTVVIDGDAVDVNNNEVLCPIKLVLYRTKADGSIFYLESEFVNDTTNATTAYTSTNADSTLTVEYVEPVKTPALPPNCKYIDTWRGQLVMTGDLSNLNTVYYSDFDGESFPADQSFITEARLGGGNSGIKSLDNSLFIFKPRSIITCTGDLGTDQFQVDALSDDGVGCAANATIQEIDGSLWFLGKQGIYKVDRTGHIKMSESIEPKFDSTYTEKRAVGYHWIEKDLYLVTFPTLLTGATIDYQDNNNTFIMVYDLYRQAWVEWNTINLIGGMAELNGKIYHQGFRRDVSDSTGKGYTFQIQDTGFEDDYADHEDSIAFTYKTHWESVGEPSIYKKFLRLKVHSLDATQDDFETDKFQLSVVTEHDYRLNEQAQFTLDFSGGISGWGETPWGQFNWGESRLGQLSSKLAPKKAKSLRTSFTNSTVRQNVLISGYEYEIAAPYDIQIKD